MNSTVPVDLTHRQQETALILAHRCSCIFSVQKHRVPSSLAEMSRAGELVAITRQRFPRWGLSTM